MAMKLTAAVKLFNATSLREAARSTTMNRYVIVFTIMTVLYLPPGFTSVLLFFHVSGCGGVLADQVRASRSSVHPYSKPKSKPKRSTGSRSPPSFSVSSHMCWHSCSFGWQTNGTRPGQLFTRRAGFGGQFGFVLGVPALAVLGFQTMRSKRGPRVAID